MSKSSNDFQNALDDALNYQAIKTNPERISKLKPYINKYNWKEIDFPAGPKDCIKFEQNNKTFALNVLNIPSNTKTISVAYSSEYKQVILLMITNGKKSHYLAVTNLSALLEKIQNLIVIIIIVTIIIISKNHIQKKRLNMSLLVGQCLQNVHLIKKKIHLITTEEKIVFKNFVKN